MTGCPPSPAIEAVPLSLLRAGASARVVSMAPGDGRRLVRFASLGLVPGALVHVQQTSPTIILHVGRTVLAFERCLAEDVYVQPADSY